MTSQSCVVISRLDDNQHPLVGGLRHLSRSFGIERSAGNINSSNVIRKICSCRSHVALILTKQHYLNVPTLLVFSGSGPNSDSDIYSTPQNNRFETRANLIYPLKEGTIIVNMSFERSRKGEIILLLLDNFGRILTWSWERSLLQWRDHWMFSLPMPLVTSRISYGYFSSSLRMTFAIVYDSSTNTSRVYGWYITSIGSSSDVTPRASSPSLISCPMCDDICLLSAEQGIYIIHGRQMDKSLYPLNVVGRDLEFWSIIDRKCKKVKLPDANDNTLNIFLRHHMTGELIVINTGTGYVTAAASNSPCVLKFLYSVDFCTELCHYFVILLYRDMLLMLHEQYPRFIRTYDLRTGIKLGKDASILNENRILGIVDLSSDVGGLFGYWTADNEIWVIHCRRIVDRAASVRNSDTAALLCHPYGLNHWVARYLFQESLRLKNNGQIKDAKSLYKRMANYLQNPGMGLSLFSSAYESKEYEDAANDLLKLLNQYHNQSVESIDNKRRSFTYYTPMNVHLMPALVRYLKISKSSEDIALSRSNDETNTLQTLGNSLIDQLIRSRVCPGQLSLDLNERPSAIFQLSVREVDAISRVEPRRLLLDDVPDIHVPIVCRLYFIICPSKLIHFAKMHDVRVILCSLPCSDDLSLDPLTAQTARVTLLCQFGLVTEAVNACRGNEVLLSNIYHSISHDIVRLIEYCQAMLCLACRECSSYGIKKWWRYLLELGMHGFDVMKFLVDAFYDNQKNSEVLDVDGTLPLSLYLDLLQESIKR